MLLLRSTFIGVVIHGQALMIRSYTGLQYDKQASYVQSLTKYLVIFCIYLQFLSFRLLNKATSVFSQMQV